jgi:hypothetical protein
MERESTTELGSKLMCVINLNLNDILFPGYYMYVDSSSPRVKGDKARIASPYVLSVAGIISTHYHFIQCKSLSVMPIIKILVFTIKQRSVVLQSSS